MADGNPSAEHEHEPPAGNTEPDPAAPDVDTDAPAADATAEPAGSTDVERVVEAPPAQKLDQYHSAEAQLDAEKIEAWRPDKADPARIIGEVLAIDLSVEVNGAVCPAVLTVNTRETGLRRVWAWHSVLLRELIAKRPQLGDVVGFAYGGRMKSASGREYVSYQVAVARESGSQPAEIDYDRLALDAGPELDPEPRTGDAGNDPPKPPPPPAAGGMLGPDDDLPFGPAIW